MNDAGKVAFKDWYAAAHPRARSRLNAFEAGAAWYLREIAESWAHDINERIKNAEEVAALQSRLAEYETAVREWVELHTAINNAGAFTNSPTLESLWAAEDRLRDLRVA